MNRYMYSLVLAAAGLLLVAGESQAQRWGWGGGRGGVSVGVGNYSGYYGSGYYGSGYGYSPYYSSYNYGYRPWYSSYTYGYSPYAPNYEYGPSYSSYSYSPSYYTTPMYSYVTPSSSNSYVRPTTSTSFYYSPSIGDAAPTMTDRAQVEVRLPADAELWIDGVPSAQRGEKRTFETPTLELGRTFTYELRARWMDNGKPVEQTRQVNLFAGARPMIDFRNNTDTNK
jgi:uncharacterized protein (TIGR03000 family)